jgi:hypothetical protein
VTSVVAGHSGMEVNNRPVLELQIHARNAPKFGMLSGRSDAELQWLAGLIETELGLNKSGKDMT